MWVDIGGVVVRGEKRGQRTRLFVREEEAGVEEMFVWGEESGTCWVSRSRQVRWKPLSLGLG